MKMLRILMSVVVSCLVSQAFCDVYFHNPRGSNDRLNERSANRENANRLFDSQNNNRGGYNVGDVSDTAATDEAEQYRMKYFQSSSVFSSEGKGQSFLTLEWTNQHGCGGNEDDDPHKQNCNIVLQYMCQENVASPTGNTNQDIFRNGQTTNSPNYEKPPIKLDASQKAAENRRKKQQMLDRGLHESFFWYDKCNVRERNKADQNLQNDNGLGQSSAIYTRQNPNGNRYGYECPEERDYYPYWHPTPWKDIAVLAENATMCSHYQSKSFNIQPYGECVEMWTSTKRKPYSQWNNPGQCLKHGGTWTLFYNYLEKAPEYKSKRECEGATDSGTSYIWAVPYDSIDGKTLECLVSLRVPECYQAPWTRSNHLGNGRDGQPNNYTWTLPYFPSGKEQRCLLRIRYNISTDDYDPYFTDSKQNYDRSAGVLSPVEQNPYVQLGAGTSPLRLAINTAQLGRTFQDRSHVFILRPRPGELKQERIFNLNVRGKRGNIVQVYPAVEYDFFPTHLYMDTEDLVHIQWTGSNRHNNNNPAGDGQAGDAGEGNKGTDRNNIVQLRDLGDNFPLPYESTTFWQNVEVKWIHHGRTELTPQDLAIGFASAGYYQCVELTCPESAKKKGKTKLSSLLDNAPASYEGALLKVKKGIYHFMCTRNNNFTNRSQKGTIIVR